ncbi:hypothetical protein [Ramlibacter sp.]|uniref:hypothetical protein n=1 Tax=Ramlibacter sp. TaxID=1917967 RepID=UPI0026297107|nr:hypothetical protein [Ramlibacter sp.]
MTGVPSRKQDLVVSIVPGFAPHPALLARLGQSKLGKSCLHRKRLADVDLAVPGELIALSVQETRRRHG